MIDNPLEPEPPAANLADNYTPLSVITFGLKEAPLASKFMLGGLVVFAGGFIVLSWGKDLSNLIPAALGILIVGLLVALLAAAVTRTRLGWLGDLLAIALVAFVIGIMGLFVSSAFFGNPPRGALLLKSIFGIPDVNMPLPAAPAIAQTPPDLIGRWLIDWIQNGTSGQVNVEHLGALRSWLDANGLKTESANDFLTDATKQLERERAVSQLGVPKKVDTGASVEQTPSKPGTPITEAGSDGWSFDRDAFKSKFSKGFAPYTWHVIVKSLPSEQAALDSTRALNAKYPNLYFEEAQSNAAMWMVTLGSGIGARSAKELYGIARKIPEFRDAYRYCWGVGVTDPDGECAKD